MARSEPRSGPTRAGSSSRSTSSISARGPTFARSGSRAISAPTPQVVAAIEAAEVIVIGPSNPIVSIGPILAGPIRALVEARCRAGVPVVAVSPIVGGVALKGPADRMLVSLGHESSARGVARMYRDLASAFVLDSVDAAAEPEIAALGLRTLVTDTIMADADGRARLARAVLDFAGRP